MPQNRAYVVQTSSRLNHIQLRRYAEQLFSTEFTRYGFSVFSPEADNRGIDLVVRNEGGDHYDVQVRASRDHNYVFLRQSVFPLRPQMYAALALFLDRQEPELYLIPSFVWKVPNELFVDKDYEAALGAVGVRITSTSPKADVKSSAISVRSFWALR